MRMRKLEDDFYDRGSKKVQALITNYSYSNNIVNLVYTYAV